MIRAALVLIVVLVGSLPGVSAHAHSRSQSFSAWEIGSREARMVFAVSAREATRLEPVPGEITLAHRLAAHVDGHIGISTGSQACESTGFPIVLAAKSGFLRVEQRYRCASTTGLMLTIDPFMETVTSHTHVASVRRKGERTREYLFSENARSNTIAGEREASAPSPVLEYFWLGFEHIFQGADHIVLLFLLLLMAGTLKELIFAVTGFTVGHSLALGLAATGWVTTKPQVVEALIGFTIVVAALDVVVARKAAGQWARYLLIAILIATAVASHTWGGEFPLVTLCGLGAFVFCWFHAEGPASLEFRCWPIITAFFGVIHGAGFASALLDLGSPTDGTVGRLIGFNAGVELAQVLIVSATWTLAKATSRRMAAPWHRRARLASAMLFASLGLYWFIERSIGI